MEQAAQPSRLLRRERVLFNFTGCEGGEWEFMAGWRQEKQTLEMHVFSPSDLVLLNSAVPLISGFCGWAVQKPSCECFSAVCCVLCARPRAELRHRALPAGGDQQEIREELECGCQAGWGVHQVGRQQPAGRKEDSPSWPGSAPPRLEELVRRAHSCAQPSTVHPAQGRPAGPGKQARKYYVDDSDPSFPEPRGLSSLTGG